MDDLPVISRRLKEARLAAAMSQKQLGIAAGIDEFSASPRINQYERGKHIPDFATIERMADVLKVPTPFFYTSNDELAQLILAYGRMNAEARNALLKSVTVSQD